MGSSTPPHNMQQHHGNTDTTGTTGGVMVTQQAATWLHCDRWQCSHGCNMMDMMGSCRAVAQQVEVWPQWHDRLD